jgi:hypothetical protein
MNGSGITGGSSCDNPGKSSGRPVKDFKAI